MTDKEKALIPAMLEDYADILGNRSCNDWNFPSNWTLKERKDFVREYHEMNGDPENFDETDENPYIADMCVVALLAYKLGL